MDTAQLVHMAQKGDDDAVRDLILRYYPRVERIVRARLGAELRRLAGVEDVTQAAFQQAVLSLRDFEMRSDSALLDWLATIVENQIRKSAEYWSRTKRSPERVVPMESADRAQTGLELFAEITGPTTRARRRELDAILEEELDRLPNDLREAFILQQLAEMPAAAIAEKLQLDGPRQARALVDRARGRLAAALRRRGITGGGDAP